MSPENPNTSRRDYHPGQALRKLVGALTHPDDPDYDIGRRELFIGLGEGAAVIGGTGLAADYAIHTFTNETPPKAGITPQPSSPPTESNPIVASDTAIPATSTNEANPTAEASATSTEEATVRPSETAPASGAMVSVENGQFVRQGKRIGFIGENWYSLAAGSRVNVCSPTLTSEQRKQWIDSTRSLGMNVIRFWDFGSITDGGKDTSIIDEILTFASPDILVYPTLDNQWGDCTGGKKLDDAWYAGGYQSEYLPFVRTMAAKYKGDARILAFQLINEGQAGDPAVFLKFATTVAAAIKAIDPMRLVTPGVLGSGQPGSAGDDFGKLMQHFDFADIHLYPDQETGTTNGLPGDAYNGVDARLQVARALGKPLLISEFGRDMTKSPLSAQQRADDDKTIVQKLLTYPNFGGILGWSLSPFNSDSGYDYAVTSAEAQMLKGIAPQVRRY
jgi:hypothetical protein